MIWIILISIIGYILFRFLYALGKDDKELQGRTLDDKFYHIVDELNDFAFEGNGNISYLDKREFNLYEIGQNQIINFLYSTGHLTITWKYKYFKREVTFERQFDNVRNINIIEQQMIVDEMINEMKRVVENHKTKVLSGF